MSEIFSVRTFATANHIRQRIIDVHALRAKMSVHALQHFVSATYRTKLCMELELVAK